MKRWKPPRHGASRSEMNDIHAHGMKMGDDLRMHWAIGAIIAKGDGVRAPFDVGDIIRFTNDAPDIVDAASGGRGIQKQQGEYTVFAMFYEMFRGRWVWTVMFENGEERFLASHFVKVSKAVAA